MTEPFFKRDLANSYTCKYAHEKMLFVYDVLRIVIGHPAFDRHGWLAFNVGFYNKVECMKLIVSAGVSRIPWNTWLLRGCFSGNTEIIDLAVSGGATNFNTGLFIACERGHLEVAKLMIKYGADNYVKSMCVACRLRRPEIATLLILYGGPEVANHGLFFACRCHPSMVRLMIENGATCCLRCENTKHPELQ